MAAVLNKIGAHVVDLRSDTVTRPTPEMRKAMFEAEVGDDVMGEDPTVNELEKKAAALLGMESAVFITSGSMGNLISILVHCNKRGSEIILGDRSHIFLYEQGTAAFLAGVQARTVTNKPDGTFDLEEVEAKIREDDLHVPITSLICVENTHNVCGGKVLPMDWLAKLVALASKHKIPLHMDGARIFNASVALKIPVSTILKGFSSVSFCLSKGLSCPVGSILAGSADFINNARRMRKALGGAMRQAGVLAAPGLVSLNKMIDRLEEDHRHAKLIAEGIAACKNDLFKVDPKCVHTNIIMVWINKTKVTLGEFCTRLQMVDEEEERALGQKIIVQFFPMTNDEVRMVLHSDISDDDCQKAILKLQYVINQVYKN